MSNGNNKFAQLGGEPLIKKRRVEDENPFAQFGGWQHKPKTEGVDTRTGKPVIPPPPVGRFPDEWERVGGELEGVTPQVPGPPEGKPIEPPSSLGFIKNIGKSGAALATGVVGALAHPIETAKGLGSIVGGGLEQAGHRLEVAAKGKEPPPGYTGPLPTRPETPSWDALVEMLKKRYGGVDQTLGTMYHDPAGFLADFAAVLSGVGAGLGVAGKVTTLSKLRRASAATTIPRRIAQGIGPAMKTVGGTAEKAAGFIDPFRATGRVIRTLEVGKKAQHWMNVLLGKTTSKGEESFKVASKLERGDPWPWKATGPGFIAFKEALGGGISGIDILKEFKGAVSIARNKRNLEYLKELNKVSNIKQPLDITSVKMVLERELKGFGIKRKRVKVVTQSPLFDASGKRLPPEIRWKPGKELDFSRSTIPSSDSQRRVRKLLEDVSNWGDEAGDLTPRGVDTLKRRLADFYSESDQARALVGSVKGEVIKILESEVPGYKEMTAKFKVASDLIEEVNSSLSLKKGGQAAMTKLMTALKENNAYRQLLVETLEQYVGDPTLKQKIAGSSLATLTPQGLVGAMAAGEMVAMLVAQTIHPAGLVAISTHSPQMMGRLMVALATMRALSKKAKGSGLAIPTGGYRALQIPEAGEEESLLKRAREERERKRGLPQGRIDDEWERVGDQQ